MSAARATPRKLIVAVTGHRLNQLPPGERKRIEREVGLCLDACATAARKAAPNGVRCILQSALAEGADRYAADAALARGWRMVTILPFSVERYAKDFATPQSRQQYYDLLEASERVIPLDAGRAQVAGYAAVGRALAEKADVMLCVWNGKPPKGPGGTSEVAALMLERGGLVLWVAVEKHDIRLVAPAPLPRAGSFRRKLHEALSRRFERVSRPLEMRVA